MTDKIELSAPAGRTFSVQRYNALTGATVGSAATGITDGTTPTRYRVDFGTTLGGVVYVVATTTNLRAVGYANQSAPGTTGYSHLVDTYEQAAPPDTVSTDTIAASVYQRLKGGSVALLAGPIEGDAADVINSQDYDHTFTVATAASSTLVFEVRRCRNDQAALLEADSAGGLLSVLFVDWDTPSDGSVTRLSASAVKVKIRAAAMTQFTPGEYYAELREITTGGDTISRGELTWLVRRSAGRRIAD